MDDHGSAGDLLFGEQTAKVHAGRGCQISTKRDRVDIAGAGQASDVNSHGLTFSQRDESMSKSQRMTAKRARDCEEIRINTACVNLPGNVVAQACRQWNS